MDRWIKLKADKHTERQIERCPEGSIDRLFQRYIDR